MIKPTKILIFNLLIYLFLIHEDETIGKSFSEKTLDAFFKYFSNDVSLRNKNHSFSFPSHVQTKSALLNKNSFNIPLAYSFFYDLPAKNEKTQFDLIIPLKSFVPSTLFSKLVSDNQSLFINYLSKNISSHTVESSQNQLKDLTFPKDFSETYIEQISHKDVFISEKIEKLFFQPKLDTHHKWVETLKLILKIHDKIPTLNPTENPTSLPISIISKVTPVSHFASAEPFLSRSIPSASSVSVEPLMPTARKAEPVTNDSVSAEPFLSRSIPSTSGVSIEPLMPTARKAEPVTNDSVSAEPFLSRSIPSTSGVFVEPLMPTARKAEPVIDSASAEPFLSRSIPSASSVSVEPLMPLTHSSSSTQDPQPKKVNSKQRKKIENQEFPLPAAAVKEEAVFDKLDLRTPFLDDAIPATKSESVSVDSYSPLPSMPSKRNETVQPLSISSSSTQDPQPKKVNSKQRKKIENQEFPLPAAVKELVEPDVLDTRVPFAEGTIPEILTEDLSSAFPDQMVPIKIKSSKTTRVETVIQSDSAAEKSNMLADFIMIEPHSSLLHTRPLDSNEWAQRDRSVSEKTKQRHNQSLSISVPSEIPLLNIELIKNLFDIFNSSIEHIKTEIKYNTQHILSPLKTKLPTLNKTEERFKKELHQLEKTKEKLEKQLTLNKRKHDEILQSLLIQKEESNPRQIKIISLDENFDEEQIWTDFLNSKAIQEIELQDQYQFLMNYFVENTKNKVRSQIENISILADQLQKAKYELNEYENQEADIIDQGKQYLEVWIDFEKLDSQGQEIPEDMMLKMSRMQKLVLLLQEIESQKIESQKAIHIIEKNLLKAKNNIEDFIHVQKIIDLEDQHQKIKNELSYFKEKEEELKKDIERKEEKIKLEQENYLNELDTDVQKISKDIARAVMEKDEFEKQLENIKNKKVKKEQKIDFIAQKILELEKDVERYAVKHIENLESSMQDQLKQIQNKYIDLENREQIFREKMDQRKIEMTIKRKKVLKSLQEQEKRKLDYQENQKIEDQDRLNKEKNIIQLQDKIQKISREIDSKELDIRKFENQIDSIENEKFEDEQKISFIRQMNSAADDYIKNLIRLCRLSSDEMMESSYSLLKEQNLNTKQEIEDWIHQKINMFNAVMSNQMFTIQTDELDKKEIRLEKHQHIDETRSFIQSLQNPILKMHRKLKVDSIEE